MSYTHAGRTLRKIAVIGSGQIGPDIALYFSKVLSPHSVQTVVVDIAAEALERGKAKLEKKIAKGVETGAFSADQQSQMLANVEFTSDYDAVRGADLVVEAATEDKALKGRIFAQVEGLVDDAAILASNSSHLEPEAIFADARLKRRTCVIHYFFPAERNPMVEVVPSADTDPAQTAWLLSFYEAIGKAPIAVQSRYGYALDPVFEGLFLASALIAESGLATTKQIDQVARSALGLTVGSFTAMNLTGGNPITAVGLDQYHQKIHQWFRTPQSLKDRLTSGEPWDTPGRGETVEVADDVAAKVTEQLRGAYFGLCGEILDAGLVSLSDFDMALELALDLKPAFRFMNQLGTAEALRLVQAYAGANPGFPVPACLADHGATNRPFDIPVVQREDRDGVAVLKIRRPKVLNALNEAVFEELRQRFRDVAADSSVRAAVLTGFGKKAFVSGADVRFLAAIETADEGEKTSLGSQSVLNEIEDMEKPVVCAMNGLAFGGGHELAMACHARVARTDLRPFAAQPEPNLGIIPGAGATQRLPRLVGLLPAAELLRTARPFSSAQALELGLIEREVPADDLIGAAVELARDLADGKTPRRAIQREPMADVPAQLPTVELGHLSTKVDEILCKAILEGAKQSLRDGLATEAKCFGAVCATEDKRIGVENFLTKGPRSRAEFVHR
ncbi:MAG: 3-hydroxyacyl-CoA dehydrogenase/enoyl-CoA hydratase family protein [Planctomycetota bacterium]